MLEKYNRGENDDYDSTIMPMNAEEIEEVMKINDSA